MIAEFVTESGSRYELDEENKRIRRVHGTELPTERQGPDGVWKGYEELIPRLDADGDVCFVIVWEWLEPDEENGTVTGRTTITSPVMDKEIVMAQRAAALEAVKEVGDVEGVPAVPVRWVDPGGELPGADEDTERPVQVLPEEAGDADDDEAAAAQAEEGPVGVIGDLTEDEVDGFLAAMKENHDD